MSALVANARMYAVTPRIEQAWQALLENIASDAGVSLTYLPYPAPQPLEVLWQRDDLGCAFMCGFPIALEIAAVTPLASPIPVMPWAHGRAVYRSDFIVRADSAITTFEDSFGKRAGWTVAHSHSGFNAFRHHLLAYRTPGRPTLYGAVNGNLVTARRILDEVIAGTIDIGPLDAYWHHLLRRERPELFTNIRVVASSDLAPMPAFVAGPQASGRDIEALRAAFLSASSQPWFSSLADDLQLEGFAAVDHTSFALTLRWHEEALAAGYRFPA